MSNATELLPGFDEPVLQSQIAFKSLLEALARPGRLFTLPAPESAVPGLSAGSAAIALTLVDYETPVWLDGPYQLAAEYLQFHCGCRMLCNAVKTVPSAVSFCAKASFLERITGRVGFVPGAETFALMPRRHGSRLADKVHDR
ncbi:MAG: phosphonate C-P lyase system protein PhnH [Orrella sp.]